MHDAQEIALVINESTQISNQVDINLQQRSTSKGYKNALRKEKTNEKVERRLCIYAKVIHLDLLQDIVNTRRIKKTSLSPTITSCDLIMNDANYMACDNISKPSRSF